MDNVEIKAPYNVWFTADLHIRHKNILRHQPNRIEAMGLKDAEDIETHDAWIEQMWLDTVKRGDHVFVVGDFILSNQQDSLKILHRLKSNGCEIHLVVGNHDKSTHKMFNMFESIDQIKSVVFKKSVYPFLEHDFQVVMCHYPMISWHNKFRGAMHLYGHVHSNSPWIDERGELMMNVGIDNPKANYRLFSLEDIYSEYNRLLGGKKLNEYLEDMRKKANFAA